MTLRVTWLGHSTVVLDIGGTRLITDPLLHRHVGLLRRRGGAPEPRTWRGAHAVLVSHLHHDHAELRSLRLLGDVPVLTAAANARWLRGKGLTGATGAADGAWVGVGNGEVRVRLTRAVHGQRPMPHRPNACSGHLIRAATGSVWIAGDTELFAGMADVVPTLGSAVDLAVVPVGGWGPRLSGGHLGPDEAARACALVHAAVAVPVHWGTLHPPGGRHLPPRWMERAGDEFVDSLARHAPDCTPVVLRPGQAWTHPD